MTSQQLTECMQRLETLTDKIIELTDKAKADNKGVMPEESRLARQQTAERLIRVKLAIEKRMS